MTPQDLVQIEHIKALKYRYLRGLDQKRWDLVAACLTPDATAAYSGGKYAYEGRDAIVDFLRSAMGSEGMLTSHRCHHPEITLTGPDTASGTWALDDEVLETTHQMVIRGAAFYADEYVREPDGWRIARTGYRRTFEVVQPFSEIGLTLTASWWGTDGVSSLDV